MLFLYALHETGRIMLWRYPCVCASVHPSDVMFSGLLPRAFQDFGLKLGMRLAINREKNQLEFQKI